MNQFDCLTLWGILRLFARGESALSRPLCPPRASWVTTHFGILECVDFCSRRRECQELSNCHYFYGTHYVIYNRCLSAFGAVYVLKDLCCSNEMSEALHQSGRAIRQSENGLYFKEMVSRLGSGLLFRWCIDYINSRPPRAYESWKRYAYRCQFTEREIL